MTATAATEPTRPALLGPLIRRAWPIAVGLGLGSALLYLVTGPEARGDMFLPPAPALTLIPIALLFGSQSFAAEPPSNVYAAGS